MSMAHHRIWNSRVAASMIVGGVSLSLVGCGSNIVNQTATSNTNGSSEPTITIGYM